MEIAVKQRVDGGDATVGREFNQPPPAFLRAVQLSTRAMSEAVHAVGVAAELGNGPGVGVKPHQPAFVDSAEQHAAVAPDHATGRAFIGSGDELELPCHVRCSYHAGTPGIFSRVRRT